MTRLSTLLDEVYNRAEAAQSAAEAAAEAETERDEAIRTAAAGGIPVRQLVEATGLSRGRIYQILKPAESSGS